MPYSFLNVTKGVRYSADSILSWLVHRENDSVSILVGLTDKDIYISDKDEWGRIKQPVSKYSVWGILGLGHCPGQVCVISDKRFGTSPDRVYDHRLRTMEMIFANPVKRNYSLAQVKFGIGPIDYS
jgi:archaemetzincin